MTTTAREHQQKQIQQAEELLFSGAPSKAGFAKELYFGRFVADAVIPYPRPTAIEQAAGDAFVAEVRRFLDEHLDAAAIDRNADIPPSVIQGLGRIGVLGATVPTNFGGRGLSWQNNCRVMEAIGGHCGSTAVFVNAHHSIGLRALEMFGTDQQQQRWMRPLAMGEQIAAFALTEPEAGSDASNVRTTATPTSDGRGFILNGEKRYITNGAIAQVLTVMARTPDPSDPDGKVTAFLVTPDTPGFQVVEARMEKVGIRGTATARLAFRDMLVPRENVLGQLGKGLKIALTVLDFGRTTFGASCTGAAKYCVRRAVEHANSRKQFGKTLGEFELVRQKIAHAAAHTFAMESATYHTAALIDSGAEDYMLETAMLKVFASDRLWDIVNDTLQIHGGAGFFTDQPFERMLRDARLNMIGEGANDVLRSFIAMVGLRGVGQQLLDVRKKPWTASQLLRVFAPAVPANHPVLAGAATDLARQIIRFARAGRNSLIRHRESILDRQFVQARLADTATELFVGSCVYSRLTGLAGGLGSNADTDRDFETGLLYLRLAHRRNSRRLSELGSNDDPAVNGIADRWLSHHD
jgi:alkylation response protein AidB-like acyl-CoA dehydrogenase